MRHGHRGADARVPKTELFSYGRAEMRYVITAEEMKYYDTATIEEIGIPSLLLMERAAMEMTMEISKRLSKTVKVLVLAGGGNNGGDALAVGRLLSEKGHKVIFWMPMGWEKVSTETGTQLHILKNMGFSIYDIFPEGEYDIIIDGLFGIGLTRDVSGGCAKAIEKVNEIKEEGAFVASVDIPSGICADKGTVMGCAVKADMTVAFAYAKAGHYFYPGKEYTGELMIKPIGITAMPPKKIPSYLTADIETLHELLPVRKPDGNKGTFGKVLVFAGSRNMCGAALLCAGGVFAAGAGMVKILTHDSNRVILQETLPEAMLLTYESQPDKDKLMEALDWADVIVAGPGIGISEQAEDIMEQLLSQSEMPFVADADGLNLLAESKRLQKAVLEYKQGNLVITPHPGELCRLIGCDMKTYQQDKRQMALTVGEKYSCIAVCKDAVTLISAKNEKTVFLNHLGNDGMAVAGSGDVLAGIIGGFLAQGQDCFDAAVAGVAVHGEAGGYAAKRMSRYAMKASDIIESLGEVLREAEEKRSFS